MSKFNINKKLNSGDNVFEFTPQQAGTITYTCWMGMIRGTIKVADDINNAAEPESSQYETQQSVPPVTDEIGGCCGTNVDKSQNFIPDAPIIK